MLKKNDNNSQKASCNLYPRRILVVEDDEGLNRLAQKSLRDAGYDVAGVLTGTAAIEAITKNGNLAMLLDHKLPDMTGVELINSLIAQNSRVPFIVMTGQGNETTAVEMMKLGASDYLAKGLDLYERLPGSFQRLFRELDIQKQLETAENSLQQSEALLKTLIDCIPDLIWLKDADGVYVSCNPRFENFFGAKEGDILGRTDYDFLDRELADFFRKNDRAAMNAGKPTVNEEELTFADDGHKEIVETIKTPMYSSNGQLIGVLGIARDITKRKQAQEDRERLMAAIEQAHEAVVITDAQGTIQYVNPVFEAITGYSRDEAMGKNPGFLKSGQQSKEFYKNMWNTLKKNEPWTGRLVNRKKDGTLYTEESVISPVLDDAGNIINYVAVKRDVTEEIKLQEQYLQAQKMEAIGHLAGGVAHDFRNQLTVIQGYSSMLARWAEENPKIEHPVDEILKAVKRSAKITGQLLVFSRKEAFHTETVDLTESIRDMSKLLPQMVGEDIRLSFVPNPKPCCANVDPGLFQQAIMNLIVNARQAMPKGGELTVETNCIDLNQQALASTPNLTSGSYAVVTVSDTGTGMEPDVVKRIFDPFFTTKEVGKGTGMGLAMVYGFVTESSGFIDVESELGKGTTFKLYFPLIKGPKPAAPPKPEYDEVPTGGETLLVVEDEEALRQLIVLMLRDCGYRVLETSNASEALPLGEHYEEKIDLLITDIVMPKMMGPELAKHLKKVRPDMKLLFISGYRSNQSEETAMIQTGAEILKKPFDQIKLAQTVRRVLDQP